VPGSVFLKETEKSLGKGIGFIRKVIGRGFVLVCSEVTLNKLKLAREKAA
jgi:hypothetical protein